MLFIVSLIIQKMSLSSYFDCGTEYVTLILRKAYADFLPSEYYALLFLGRAELQKSTEQL